MGVMVNHAGLSVSVAGVPHAGMFHEFGLINHSCAPKFVQSLPIFGIGLDADFGLQHFSPGQLYEPSPPTFYCA
jgi:hypothetical protein